MKFKNSSPFVASLSAFLALVLAASTVCLPSAHSEITLVDTSNGASGWKLGMYGFLEFDAFYDSTRGFGEFQGNASVPRKGTLNGDNGRTQFSLRNSRFGWNFVAPEYSGWKTRANLELDFLGYDPAPAPFGNSTTEASFFTNATVRFRHAYFVTEKEKTQILIGQTWSFFGWQSNYLLSSISVNPDAGALYQRTAQIRVTQTLAENDTTRWQAGLSLERPSQRDGKIPNVNVGAHLEFPSWKGGTSSPNSNMRPVNASLSFTGTYRQYESANNITQSDSDQNHYSAFAGSADAFIPILPAVDSKNIQNSLSLTAEFTAGKGYGDEFANWSGGVSQTFGANTNSATQNNTSIDPGLGGYAANGTFELVQLQSFNTQLQYFIANDTFCTVGYGQLFSSNTGDFRVAGVATTNGIAAAGLYDRVEAKFVNIAHDFSTFFRVGVEFDQFTTHYVDGATSFNNRYLLASYFRF